MNLETEASTLDRDYKGYPWGWFVVAFSDEVEVGHVRPMHYFGQELVLYRGESGQVKVLDAFCPHLGAHLGIGGKVVEDTIRCPFHAWRFDETGACVEVPYAKKIPPRATGKIDCWPVSEKNGMIFVWHHPDKAAPHYEIPDLEGYGDPEWTPWYHAMLEVKTHPREIVENVADIGHFIPVHGTHVNDFENIYEAHRATQISKGVAYPLGGGEDHFTLDATYHGPGYQVTEMDGFLESRLVNAHTPITREGQGTLDLRFAVSIKRTGDKAKDELFARGYVDNLREGFLQDVRIWENKVYRERPILCDGDGPIGKLRRWYKQFYRPVG